MKEWAHRSVEHELAINDLGIAVLRACDRADWAPTVWLDDDQLRGLHDSVTLAEIIPDAFALIERGERGVPLFFEIDRGTESVTGVNRSTRDWASKIERYTRLLNTPGLLAPLWNKLMIDQLPLAQPLVLTVTTTDVRLRHLVNATAKSPSPSLFWYTTSELIRPRQSIMGGVWTLSGDSEPIALGSHIERHL